MKYRVFTNDVGPRRDGYSCLAFFDAASDGAALLRAMRMARRFAPVKVLAIPDELVASSFRAGSETAPGGMKPLKGVLEKYGAVIW